MEKYSSSGSTFGVDDDRRSTIDDRRYLGTAVFAVYCSRELYARAEHSKPPNARPFRVDRHGLRRTVSKEGSPSLEVHAEGLRVAVIAAMWHQAITDSLLAGALRAVRESGAADPTVVRVPGAFELAAAAARLAPSHDAVVALGVVIRGDTPHFEYVCQAATVGLTQVSVSTATPVGFGVLTCDNETQALDRAGLPDSSEDKGFEATQAALSVAVALKHAGC